MSDYSPTSTPDLSTLAEREREELRRRTGIGVVIAIVMVALLAAFIAVDPDRIGSVLLAGGVLAGVGLISWMRHCGSGHEHQRLRDQNLELLTVVRKLQKSTEAARTEHRQALEAARVEHQAALTALAETFEAALRDLAGRIDANERAQRVEDATRLAKKINRHLESDDAEHRPGMGQTVLHSVAANTPARGYRKLSRYHDEGEPHDG